MSLSLSLPLVNRPIKSSQSPPLNLRRPFRSASAHNIPLKASNRFPNLPLRFSFAQNLRSRFLLRSSPDEIRPLEPDIVVDDRSSGQDEAEARGQSTLPSQFRYLTKEVLDRPVRWPWLIAVVFLIYAWRMVLWELTNWKKSAFAIAGFMGYVLKLVLAIIFHFIGDPITSFIRYIETFLYFIHSIYASIVGYAPVRELTVIILLTTSVVATAEATVPSTARSQPYTLTLAGLIAYFAIDGSIPELLFWPLLSALFCFSRFVKNRDNVSAALPVAAAAAAVGEPWVRGLAIVSYLALAIVQHSRTVGRKAAVDTDQNEKNGRKLPFPLLCTALSIGIHLAAKWIRFRHLTWKAL